MPTAQDILRVARTWLGTPFAHQGRQRGIRCDCIGLIIEVCREVGLVDAAGLPAGWNHTAYGRLPETYGTTHGLLRYLTRVPRGELHLADIVLFRTSLGDPAHMGFLGDAGAPWSLIHAFNAKTIPQSRVQEHRLGGAWLARLHSAYRLPLDDAPKTHEDAPRRRDLPWRDVPPARESLLEAARGLKNDFDEREHS